MQQRQAVVAKAAGRSVDLRTDERGSDDDLGYSLKLVRARRETSHQGPARRHDPQTPS